MLQKTLRILEFDKSVTRQARLFSQYPVKVTDFTSLASSARLFFSASVRRKIAAALKPEERNYPTFLGSGDFHHISEVLTSQIEQPVCLIVFDFHPDWDVLPPHLGCGSWVSQALKNKNIAKCVLLGAGSDDLSGWGLQSGNFSALNSGRLEIYPFRHKPSKVYFQKISGNNSVIAKQGFFSSRLIWHELEKEDLTGFILNLIKRLPAKRAYISIDKDCLQKDFALTNWEEGLLRLDQLLTMLKILCSNLEVVGLDIVGDYSPPVIPNKLKALLSRLDHPSALPVDHYPAEAILKINEETNLKILQTIFS